MSRSTQKLFNCFIKMNQLHMLSMYYQQESSVESQSKRSKREIRTVEFQLDGEKHRLHLSPIEHDVAPKGIPIWTVKTDYRKPSFRSYDQIHPENIGLNGLFYQDTNKSAVLWAYYKDNYIYYDGLFGESKNAKRVRSELEKWWTPRKNSVNNYANFGANENDIIHDSKTPNYAYEKLAEPLSIMYPKLLVVVEYNYFKALGNNITETVRYISTLWNAINLKYSRITSLEIKIMITGIIIQQDPTALRFIHDSCNNTDEGVKLSSHKMLNLGADYFRMDFNNEVNFKNYDSVIVMTNLNAGSIAGQAFLGKICDKYNNVAFVGDDTTYFGVNTGAHELGHLLSLPHDKTASSKDCDYLPSPGVATIMAPFVPWVDRFIWSECSEKRLKIFAGSTASECTKYTRRN
ncbi:hypothetical protein QAD02_000934 [Eretmocerus hayati]|uniref:Uncharacterized protein n=1 Tax=Eretmocerus hayati TaxID=131215 RepID=A0ACC2NJF1_9HYME|nr:hypothetical protein QAD02_000934 [Eretmocerus hayati]